MALVKADAVQKELYSAVEQINVILKNITDRLDKLEEKPARKANVK
jgi:hypothetical protein